MFAARSTVVCRNSPHLHSRQRRRPLWMINVTVNFSSFEKVDLANSSRRKRISCANIDNAENAYERVYAQFDSSRRGKGMLSPSHENNEPMPCSKQEGQECLPCSRMVDLSYLVRKEREGAGERSAKIIDGIRKETKNRNDVVSILLNTSFVLGHPSSVPLLLVGVSRPALCSRQGGEGCFFRTLRNVCHEGDDDASSKKLLFVHT